VEASEGCRIALIIFDEPSATCNPGKGSFNNPSSGKEHKASLGFRQLYNREPDPFRCGRLCRSFASVSLIDIGTRKGVTGGVLDVGSQASDGVPIANVGRCYVQCQQVTKGVDRHVDFRSALPFGSVIPRSCAAFRRQTQHAAIHDRSRRFLPASCRQTQDGAQILRQGLEASRCQPAVGLLVDRC
jgi:hypothetical protein